MSSIGRRAFARILLLSGVVFTAACADDLPTVTADDTQPSLSYDPNTYYVIRNAGSDKVMDVSNAGCCNGQWIHQWTYDGSSNQEWSIISVGGGYYKIIARHSGKGMDIESASQYNGAQLHQWTYQSLYNQQFAITPSGSNGTYYITARHSGKALTVSGTLSSNGSEIQQSSYVGASYMPQQWRIEEASL
ncbi:MAG TPA: RICIN domain-containing protein [Longimicrobiaceae bacterium]|nr:RICIN domain-containing protein [Longimicrobiaceae bacterium]